MSGLKQFNPRVRLPNTQQWLFALPAFATAALCFYLNSTLGLVGRGGYDQINFHAPTISTFASQWPHPQFNDYLSATTPGYHVFLAILKRYIGDAAVLAFSISISASFFTFLIAHVTGWIAYAQSTDSPRQVRVSEWVLGTLVVLPFIASPYVLSSAIWLLPDNLAWLLVFLTLQNLLAGVAQPRYLIPASVFLFQLVAVRQIHLWAAAPIIIAAYCSYLPVSFNPSGIVTPPTRFISELRESLATNLAKRVPFALLAAFLTLPSIVLLYYFFNLWHGLTPPTFQGQYPIDPSKPLLLRLFNAPAAPAFILALFGVFGVFYAGFWLPALIKSLKNRGVLPLLISALLLALLFAVIPATTESMPLGRWSGLWQFTSKLPIIAGHTSTLILALALLGAVTLCGFLTSMRASHAAVCFTAIAGFAAAQAASFQLWQRYNEPFVLIMLILMTTIIIAQREEKVPAIAPLLSRMHRLRFAGPAILAIALGALSYTTFKNAKPSDFFDLQPGTDRTRAFLKGDESIKPVPLPKQNP